MIWVLPDDIVIAEHEKWDAPRKERKEVGEIQQFILSEREAKDEKEIPYMTASIKADETVTMGIITDVKTELRKVNALKINYSTKKRD